MRLYFKALIKLIKFMNYVLVYLINLINKFGNLYARLIIST